MNTAANNTTLKQYIVRISPVTQSPVLFDAQSKDNGRLTAIIGNEVTEVGLDYYTASAPMEPEQARKVVQAYAEHAHIPVESILVRSRLPKSGKPMHHMRRKTDDANLVLVKSDKQPAEARSGDELTKAAQEMQNKHDDEKKGKASASNPEGATVKKEEAAPRTKRKYTRTAPAVRNAKSAAALRRYQQELLQSQSKQPEAFEPTPTNATQEEIDERTLKLAIAIAKALKEVA